MVDLSIDTKDIIGLIPALDSRKTDKARVIDGINFVWDADGPYSGFGNEFLADEPFTDPEYIATFRVEGTIYYTAKTGIYLYDSTNKMFIPQMLFDASSEDSPWSWCEVGTINYFCHLAIGIISYNPLTEAWASFTPASLPTNPTSIANVGGRLVVLGDNNVAWSALDDGSDLVPSLVTGAGAQAISLIGGTPFAVKVLSDGFITYTSEGIMKSTYIGGGVTYRHRPVTTETKPINAFCIVSLERIEHVFLDKKGLYTLTGNNFKPLDPLMNDYLFNSLFKSFGIETTVPNYRIQYNNTEQLLFLSVSTTDASRQFSYALVYNTAVGKWGQFNYLHYSFLEIDIAAGSSAGIVFGYVDGDGIIRSMSRQHFVENASDKSFADFYQPLVEFPSRKIDDKHTMASIMYLTAYDEADIEDLGSAAGYFTNIINTPVQVLARTLVDLDSFIQVGLFRFTEQQFVDQIGYVADVSIGAGYTPVGQVIEDWLILTGFEDWNTDTGEEDWGEGIPSQEDFEAVLESFYDGRTIENSETLSAHRDEGAQKYYWADTSGIYFGVRVKAQTVGHVYHVKYIEFAGTVLGRL